MRWDSFMTIETESTERQSPLLQVDDLTKYFATPTALFATGKLIRAVDGVSFTIKHGETLALVGESGSGKSTVGRCMIRLIEPTSGSIRLQGTDITHLSRRSLRARRRFMHMVFQDPYSSLNPRMTINKILSGPLRYSGLSGRKETADRVAGMLEKVGLRPEFGKRYPHSLSGGQRQRVAIARALIAGSVLIVADEAISALDTSIQAAIINLLKDLQREINFGCLFITHDLSAAEVISDYVAVMYLGQLVELGTRSDVLLSPKHPYSQSLLSAVLQPDPIVQRARTPIVLTGDLPSPVDPPSGCRFRTRCPVAVRRCAVDEPPLLPVAGTPHLARCHLIGSDGSAPNLLGLKGGRLQ
jgi:oligopeptide/dipeptide ABC transporter ATP-binding protein